MGLGGWMNGWIDDVFVGGWMDGLIDV